MSLSEAQLDAVFRAMASPARRAIIAHLARGHALPGELATMLGVSAPAVSRHLRTLEAANLIRTQRDGRRVECHLQREPMRQASHWLHNPELFWLSTLQAFGKHIEEIRHETPTDSSADSEEQNHD